MRFQDPFGDCYDFDIYYQVYYQQYSPEIELDKSGDENCNVIFDIKREFGWCETNEKSGFFLVLSLNKEKATAFSKGVHCYQTCGSNYTPNSFVCDLIEIGEAGYTPKYYKIIEPIEDVESEEGSNPWVTF